MTLLLALALSLAPAASRCPEIEARAANAPAPALLALLQSLPRPVLSDGRPGKLSAVDAAIDALKTQPEAGLTAARATLHATCVQLALAPAAPARMNSQALTTILAEPQFAGRGGQAWALERLVARALDLLKELLQQRGFHSFSLVGRDVFLALVVALVLVAGWRVVRKRPGVAPAQADVVGAVVVERSATEEELAAQAAAALSAGDGRTALRLEMRAVVVALGARGFAGRQAASTNRELVQLLARAAPALQPQLQTLTELFDATIYGERPVNPLDATRFLADGRRLRRALPVLP